MKSTSQLDNDTMLPSVMSGGHPAATTDKSEYVRSLFGSISSTYDFANDVITFGMARLWRKKLVQLSQVKPGQDVLDCATGTGDLAFEFKRAVGASGSVTGIDFCKEMLELAPQKSLELNLPVRFELADVLNLKFPSDEFAVTSIAYGMRNVSNTELALREMARVTRPGGYVMILETGEIRNPIMRFFIRMYFEKIVPVLGGWVSGNKGAYQYLQRSSGQFPSGRDFCTEMVRTGCFDLVEYKSLMGGASFIYRARVK